MRVFAVGRLEVLSCSEAGTGGNKGRQRLSHVEGAQSCLSRGGQFLSPGCCRADKKEVGGVVTCFHFHDRYAPGSYKRIPSIPCMQRCAGCFLFSGNVFIFFIDEANVMFFFRI